LKILINPYLHEDHPLKQPFKAKWQRNRSGFRGAVLQKKRLILLKTLTLTRTEQARLPAWRYYCCVSEGPLPGWLQGKGVSWSEN
jgi:hypothetical protein